MDVVGRINGDWLFVFIAFAALFFLYVPFFHAACHQAEALQKGIPFESKPAARLKEKMVVVIKMLNTLSAKTFPERQRAVEILCNKAISLLAPPDENNWFDRVSYLQVPLSVMAKNKKILNQGALDDFLNKTARLISIVCTQIPLFFGSNGYVPDDSDDAEYDENPHPTQLLAILFSGLSENKMLFRHRSLQELIFGHRGLQEAFFTLARVLIQRGANPECEFVLAERRVFRCAIDSIQGCIVGENKVSGERYFWILAHESLLQWRHTYRHPYGILNSRLNTLNLEDALLICRRHRDVSRSSQDQVKVRNKVDSVLKFGGILRLKRSLPSRIS